MGDNHRILVVEDEPQVAEILQWNLQGAGYDVTVVRDGVDALLAFDAERPALITVDLNLPRVSGFRLVKLLKRYAPDVPVIVVTALDFEEAEETAEAGADNFITKPFDPQDVIQKIAYHLDRNRPSQPNPPPLLPTASSRDRASIPVA
jgi:DNA-binding response OmpR family regulator